MSSVFIVIQTCGWALAGAAARSPASARSPRRIVPIMGLWPLRAIDENAIGELRAPIARRAELIEEVLAERPRLRRRDVLRQHHVHLAARRRADGLHRVVLGKLEID